MQIELYKKNNINYDWNGNYVLNLLECKQAVELNGNDEIEATVLYDKEENWKDIKNEDVIKVEIPNKSNSQLYRIYELEKTLDGLLIKARHIFFDLANKLLVDVRPTDSNGQEYLNKILSNTKFKGSSDIGNKSTSYYVRKNIVEALLGDEDNSFLKRLGGELWLDNYNVYINNKIGDDYGVTCSLDTNITGITAKENYDNICIRALPIASDELMLPEKFIDSKNINKYAVVREKIIELNYIKVQKEGEETQEATEGEILFKTKEEAYKEMRKAVLEKFEKDKIDIPKIEYSIDIIDLESKKGYENLYLTTNIGLGDTVHIEDSNLDIIIDARCLGYELDLLTKEYTSIKLANFTDDAITDMATNISIAKSTLDNITRNGQVKASMVKGIIDATKTLFRAQHSIEQKQQVRAILFEDLDKSSATFGAMSLGTMGFAIASERTLDGKDWKWSTFGTGKGFVADFITAGTMLGDRIKGGIISNFDDSLMIDLSSTEKGMQFKKNNQKSIDINNNKINFYDWEATTDSKPISQIITTRDVKDTSNYNLSIALNNYKSSFDVSKYHDDGLLYTLFNIDWNKVSMEIPLKALEGFEVWKDSTFNGYVNFYSGINTNNSYIYTTKDKKNYICNTGDNKIKIASPHGWALGHSDNSADLYYTPSSSTIWADEKFVATKNLHVNGDFTCSGNKNCVQETENYNSRLLYATEDARPIFTDTFTSKTLYNKDKNNFEVKIYLDKIFKECIYTEDYFIFLTKKGKGDIWIKEQTEDYFVIESELELEFNCKVEGIRKGYRNTRLELEK